MEAMNPWPPSGGEQAQTHKRMGLYRRVPVFLEGGGGGRNSFQGMCGGREMKRIRTPMRLSSQQGAAAETPGHRFSCLEIARTGL
jgi:hypothetical protein